LGAPAAPPAREGRPKTPPPPGGGGLVFMQIASYAQAQALHAGGRPSRQSVVVALAGGVVGS